MGRVTREKGYLLDNQQSEAGRRFEALSELFDSVTFRHLSGVGLSPGWACWEVGAGGVSVPTWLADKVGGSGRVVASDIDPAWMAADGATFEVLRHDVGVEPPPSGEFDLVHARLLRETGLEAVQADAFFPISSPACNALEIATVQQIREQLLAAGLASETEIEQHLTNVASGQLDPATAPLISAWARKPSSL